MPERSSFSGVARTENSHSELLCNRFTTRGARILVGTLSHGNLNQRRMLDFAGAFHAHRLR